MGGVLCLGLSAVLSASVPPAVNAAFFASHREKLASQMPQDGVVVLRSAPPANVEVDDVYRQDSDLWYLTGLYEPDCVAVLRPGQKEARYVLFVQPKNFAQEQWTGRRAGVEGAKRDYGADEAYPITELWDRLPRLLKGAASLHFRDGGDKPFRERLLSTWAVGDANARGERPVADVGPRLHQLRLVKDASEQAVMRHAAELSAEAHRAAMREVRPGRWEYALKAAMVGVCIGNGAARMAYPPIVGSGPNSVILHHAAANRLMAGGEMLVNDTACEYGMYAADVTRSYPVSGHFTPDQRAVYDIVLAAQKAGFEKVKPGTEFHEVHEATVAVIVDGLLKLGILTGDKEELVRTRAFRKFYPHGSSHWLGLNVHDVGSYGYPEGVEASERYYNARTRLEPGMVLTVEPGIYIPEGGTPEQRWWNIGVRIEDDVLVTPTGMECLSCAAPREALDIEKAIAGK